MKNKLEKLLYRKNVLEFTLRKYEKGAKVYVEYCENLKLRIKNKDYKNKLECSLIEKELIENEIKAKNYITSYKNSLAEYKDYLIPEIDTEKTKHTNVEFKDFEKTTKKLSEYELFGETTVKPANVEIPTIINDIENHISLLDRLEDELKKAIDKSSGLEKVKLEMELFEAQNHHLTLKKRLNNRQEYYYKVFLPKYEIELAEAKKMLPTFLKIAEEIVQEGIDPRLNLLLQEYEKHKDEEDTLWLFFTALKTRLKNIKEELMKTLEKPKLLLMKTII